MTAAVGALGIFCLGLLIGSIVGFISAAHLASEVFMRTLGKFVDDEDVLILNHRLRDKVERARRQ